MSRRTLVFALAILAAHFACAAEPTSDQLDLQVEVRGSQKPERVSLQSEDQLDPVPLKPDAQGSRYVATVKKSALRAPGKATLRTPAQLVVNWADSAENLYLNIGPTTPSRIHIGFIDPSRPAVFDPASLNTIDGLGRDFESLLQRYLLARRFHKHWRFTEGSPNHEIAIRSARIWFDAQTALITSKPTVFGPDPELVEMIAKYKSDSLADANVKRRFHRFFPPALLVAATRQIAAAPFSVVGQVPKLLQSGNLVLARQVNSAAFDALTGGDAALRDLVRDEQGVTISMLRENDQFIEARMQRAGISDDQDDGEPEGREPEVDGSPGEVSTDDQ